MRRLFLCFGFLLGLLPSLVMANEPVWKVDPKKSSVSFEYLEGGKSKKGAFDVFTASIVFDSKSPESASASVSVVTASIDLNDAMREGVLGTNPWFNSGDFPRAEFSLKGLRPVGSGTYLADGVLRIKTVKLPVQVMVKVTLNGNNARAVGTLEIDRTDFRLRDVLLESVVSIGERVTIGFDLIATLE